VELKAMKYSKRIIFILLLVVLFSCEDNKYFTNCDSCTSEEPHETILSIDIDKPNEKGVKIVIYEGRLEDNIVYDAITLNSSTSYDKKVSLNRTYTITATYIISGKSYTVVNSTSPRVRYTETLCQEPCYYVYDNTANLKRKYVK
jgi:hypothetical protein